VARLLGNFIEVQGEVTHLLSRMPQFCEWLDEQHIGFDGLSADDKDALAEKYVCSTKLVDGEERLYDGMLQRYLTWLKLVRTVGVDLDERVAVVVG
jgi:hypothetical protein